MHKGSSSQATTDQSIFNSQGDSCLPSLKLSIPPKRWGEGRTEMVQFLTPVEKVKQGYLIIKVKSMQYSE